MVRGSCIFITSSQLCLDERPVSVARARIHVMYICKKIKMQNCASPSCDNVSLAEWQIADGVVRVPKSKFNFQSFLLFDDSKS